MLETLLSVFSSSGVGALVGLVGSWLTKKEERKNLAMTLDHEKTMYQLKSAQQQQHNQHQLKLAQWQTTDAKQQGELAVELTEAKAFMSSQQMNKPLSNGFTEWVRGLMRPVITLYLLAIATVVALHINAYMGEVNELLSQQELVAMYQETLDRIMFLTTTAVTWWFGSRPSHSRK